MYNVSNQFTATINSDTRQLDAYISMGGFEYSNEVVSIKPSFAAADGVIVGQVISKSVDIELNISKAEYLAQFKSSDEVIAYIGVVLESTTEYVPQGKFLIKSYDYDEDKGILKLSCIDYMAETDKHTVSEIAGLTYPTTVDNYLTVVCTACGIVKSQKAYWGSDATLSQAPNFNGSESLREALKGIAEMCLGNCYMNKSGQLEISCIAEGTVQPITADTYFTAKFGEKIIGINSVALVRTPANDIIYANDSTLIARDGLSALTIENNPFMDYNREVFAPIMLEKIKGLSFYPGEVEWRGNPAFECFENITLSTVDNGIINTFLFSEELSFNGGLKSKFSNKCGNKKVVEYAKGSTLKERVRNTEIQVDKVSGQITSIVESIYSKDETDNKISSQMKQTENSVDIKIENLKTSGDVSVLKSTTVQINDTGVNVGKNDSDFRSTLSDTGVYLISRGNTIAQFNNTGAVTKNLTVNEEMYIGNLRLMKTSVSGAPRTYIHFIK